MVIFKLDTTCQQASDIFRPRPLGGAHLRTKAESELQTAPVVSSDGCW